ncbi:recombinase family protein [Brevundimonas diminuta]|uniref:recombinase family protein n=1 Tax=Brevundimonas diminuta TaxID=293 RepID=UPI003D9A83AF
MVSQTIQPTIPATIYVRWSSEAQTGRDSLRRQLESAQRYADEHRLLIVETIIDEAVSAFSGHHLTKGRLGEFIRRVEDRAVALPHVLICESLDRLNRQAPLDALAPFIGLINAGITLVTLTDRQRFTRQSMADDGGLRLLGSLIVMLRAHEESATKSKRVRAAWERKRREADVRKLTKTCPAWLRLSPDRSRFEIIEERADVVRMIFLETTAGIGKGSIAARLNAAGVPAFRGKHGWHASYIQKLLSSDAAVGTYQPHTMEDGRRVPIGPPVLNYFPPIVDHSLMMKARAAIITRRTGTAGRKGSAFRNILTGIARCAACGGSMTYVAKGDAERYLACSTARRRRACDCRALFNFNEAERRFLDAALTFDPTERNTPGASRTREGLRRASRDVARLSGRLMKLLNSFGGDATDEIVVVVETARDQLRLARIAEAGLRDQLVVEEYGANLPDLRAAISELRAADKSTPASSMFVVRARIAHAAKAAGFTATFHEHERRVELRCAGYDGAVSFSCVPQKADPARGPLGQFAKRAHDG